MLSFSPLGIACSYHWITTLCTLLHSRSTCLLTYLPLSNHLANLYPNLLKIWHYSICNFADLPPFCPDDEEILDFLDAVSFFIKVPTDLATLGCMWTPLKWYPYLLHGTSCHHPQIILCDTTVLAYQDSVHRESCLRLASLLVIE